MNMAASEEYGSIMEGNETIRETRGESALQESGEVIVYCVYSGIQNVSTEH